MSTNNVVKPLTDEEIRKTLTDLDNALTDVFQIFKYYQKLFKTWLVNIDQLNKQVASLKGQISRLESNVYGKSEV